jgi:hypothetical protein
MESLEDLRARLEREQAALAQTVEAIDAAKRRAAELTDRHEALKKRIVLLRQYIEAVEAGGDEPIEVELSGGTESADDASPSGTAAVDGGPAEPESPGTPPGRPHAGKRGEPQPRAQEPERAGEPAAEDTAPTDDDGLQYAGKAPDPIIPPRPAEPPSVDQRPFEPATTGRDSVRSLDDRQLSEEILPRTHTFEEALLLLLANRGSALKPDGIAREFRRLNHLPEAISTDDSILRELESRPQFFERRHGGGFGLTSEGREEASRVLARLVY